MFLKGIILTSISLSWFFKVLRTKPARPRTLGPPSQAGPAQDPWPPKPSWSGPGPLAPQAKPVRPRTLGPRQPIRIAAMQFNRQFYRQFNRQFNKQFNRRYNRQFNRQFNRQYNRQYNRQLKKYVKKMSSFRIN